jgi:hypothetical protein
VKGGLPRTRKLRRSWPSLAGNERPRRRHLSLSPLHSHAPRKRSTQYSQTVCESLRRQWLLGHPRSRMMTSESAQRRRNLTSRPTLRLRVRRTAQFPQLQAVVGSFWYLTTFVMFNDKLLSELDASVLDRSVQLPRAPGWSRGFVSVSCNSQMFHDELPPKLSASVSDGTAQLPRAQGFVSGSGNSRMFHDELPPELSASVSDDTVQLPRAPGDPVGSFRDPAIPGCFMMSCHQS